MPKDDLTPDQSSMQFASIQEKNLQHLIKVLGTKQSIDALTALGDVDKDTWKDIKESVVSLKDFVIGGGISSIKEEIKDIIYENAQGALTPLYNELQPIINELYKAVEPLMPYITEFTKWAVDVAIPFVEWLAEAIQDILDLIQGKSDLDIHLEDRFGEGISAWRERWDLQARRDRSIHGGRTLDDRYIMW